MDPSDPWFWSSFILKVSHEEIGRSSTEAQAETQRKYMNQKAYLEGKGTESNFSARNTYLLFSDSEKPDSMDLQEMLRMIWMGLQE